MSPGDDEAQPDRIPDTPELDPLTRERLGRQLQALYEPVLEETLDPRLAELLRELEQAREALG